MPSKSELDSIKRSEKARRKRKRDSEMEGDRRRERAEQTKL